MASTIRTDSRPPAASAQALTLTFLAVYRSESNRQCFPRTHKLAWLSNSVCPSPFDVPATKASPTEAYAAAILPWRYTFETGGSQPSIILSGCAPRCCRFPTTRGAGWIQRLPALIPFFPTLMWDSMDSNLSTACVSATAFSFAASSSAADLGGTTAVAPTSAPPLRSIAASC